jgi:hypothetical protein
MIYDTKDEAALKAVAELHEKVDALLAPLNVSLPGVQVMLVGRVVKDTA